MISAAGGDALHWSAHPLHLSGLSICWPAVDTHCVTHQLAQCVCLSHTEIAQNYYDDTLVGSTFKGRIPRVAICSRCQSASQRDNNSGDVTWNQRGSGHGAIQHNWFGDRVSRWLLCPVSYVSRYLSMCFAFSYRCHSMLYHIVHKLPSVICATLSLYDFQRMCFCSTPNLCINAIQFIKLQTQDVVFIQQI